MILYLDTSSLVKLYVDEPGSSEVQGWVERAELVTTSVVAYAEARAALARRRREKYLKPAGYRRAKAALDADWPSSWRSRSRRRWPGAQATSRNAIGSVASMHSI